jgi:hypothetical protein
MVGPQGKTLTIALNSVRRLAVFAILLSVIPAASACAVVEGSTPREAFHHDLQEATTVAIFRLESARVREGASGETIEGAIRVLETLKGSKPRFSRISIETNCSWTRLAVGGYFLVATNQSGRILKVEISDYSVLDVTANYLEGDRGWTRDRSNLGPIFDFLEGKPLSPDFPSLDMLARSKDPMWRKHHENDK